MNTAAYKFISKAYIIDIGNIICNAEMFIGSKEGLANVSTYC